VIDVRPANQNRCRQCEHLAARSSATDAIDEPDRLIDERFKTETHHKHGGHDQPGVGDQRLGVERHLDAVDPGDTRLTGSASTSNTVIFAAQGRLFRGYAAARTLSYR
jgi:hypothetical protein